MLMAPPLWDEPGLQAEPADAPLASEPAGEGPQGGMPILYDAIDPYQGTLLFP